MGTMPNLTNGSCMVVHWVAAYLPFTNTSNRGRPVANLSTISVSNMNGMPPIG